MHLQPTLAVVESVHSGADSSLTRAGASVLIPRNVVCALRQTPDESSIVWRDERVGALASSVSSAASNQLAPCGDPGEIPV